MIVADTYAPVITVGCPADMSGVTEPGQPYATLSWIIPQAEDYSPAKLKSDLIASPQKDPYNLLSSVSMIGTNNVCIPKCIILEFTRHIQLFKC